MTISDQIAEDERADHGRARARGERLLHLADAILDALIGNGIPIRDTDTARCVIFHVCADDMYGNQSIDVPTLRRSHQ